MFSLETLDIGIDKFKEDSFEASFLLGNEYFESLEDADIQRGEVHATVAISEVATGEYELHLTVEGSVTVQCDRCLDDMEQPVTGESVYTVRTGQAAGGDDDILWVDSHDGVLSVAWPIYETIALFIPIKHVHAPGQCNDAMTQKFNELSATRSGDETEDDATDPRWAQLATLK